MKSGQVRHMFPTLYWFGGSVLYFKCRQSIKLLESPIPAAAPSPPPSQKASSDDISGTKRGTRDPPVSK